MEGGCQGVGGRSKGETSEEEIRREKSKGVDQVSWGFSLLWI